MSDNYMREVIEPNDRASRLAHQINIASFRNCPAVRVVPHQPGNFRGSVGWAWNKPVMAAMAKTEYSGSGEVTDWVMLQEAGNDGAGGKPQFSTLLGTVSHFQRLFWEVITMTADDFARTGRFPCIIINEAEIQRITKKNFHLVKALFLGLGETCAEAGLVSLTGETAVLKHTITGFCDQQCDDQLLVSWGGTCIGLAHKDKLLDSRKIGVGMPIVGFWEPGYRCNGGTFFTKVLLSVFGPEIEKIRRNPAAMAFVRKLATPSKSYARFICERLGWNNDGTVNACSDDIVAIAHITGGGLWGKFGEILPQGVGAELNNMPKPAPVLLEGQRLAQGTEHEMSDWKAHSTLHGGCGMILVCPNDSAANVICLMAERAGIKSQVIGQTVASHKNEVVITKSRFLQSKQLSSVEPE